MSDRIFDYSLPIVLFVLLLVIQNSKKGCIWGSNQGLFSQLGILRLLTKQKKHYSYSQQIIQPNYMEGIECRLDYQNLLKIPNHAVQ